MQWVNWAILVLFFSGVGAWLLRLRPMGAGLLGAGGCVLAGGLGLCGALQALIQREFATSRILWNAPYASFHLGLDSLSAIFLLPLFIVGTLAAISALRRLPGDYAANHPHEHWLFFNCTLAAAALAIVARNAVLFLFAWEGMTVASFLLVENDQRAAGGGSGGGWVYLTAGHIGGACLFALFALLGATAGGLDFGGMKAGGAVMSAAFVLAYLGFGGKIGLAPLHAWYPEGYPPAPAHVGAILSGVIGNMGLYGLLRTLLLLAGTERPPAWWGYLLLFSGLGSALFGAARALASRDLSRLLAWSSVENFGLMACGVGLGLLGAASGDSVVSYLGFAGAILHMLNHSVAKALLFLSAGAVYARTGTRDLDRMGGLLKRIPVTGFLFLIGALGAAAIAPLNGFFSEFLLLASAYNGAAGNQPASAGSAAMFLAVVTLAVAGGLAAAAYMKGFGFTFLGNPRGAGAASNSPERTNVLLPHAVLAGLAIAMAAVSPRLIQLVSPTCETLVELWRQSPSGNMDLEIWLSSRSTNLTGGAAAGCWLIAGVLALCWLVRFALTHGKAKAAAGTWDCGYAAPDNRMQYSASSFSRPLSENFRAFAAIADDKVRPVGLFPGSARFSSSGPGIEKAGGFSQIFRAIAWVAARVRVLQAGRVQIYLLYMAAVLVALLLWKL